jgi:1-deoxy-D-xylulose-5-phosphate reductoisomerase
MKKVAIVGSTGSIGTQALSIIEENPDRFAVVALTARSNIALLARQVKKFGPDIVAVSEEAAAEELTRSIESGLVVRKGISGVCSAVADSGADIVLSCAVGSVGILPTLAAIDGGMDVALANKETLVAAGEVVTARARERGARLIPVDSEHSALFQALRGHDYDGGMFIKRLILTASGGPFWQRDADSLARVTPDEAVKHPRWHMGVKISIDSATMMNKALEIIEARWLFEVPGEKIDVLIHPQSIVHSLVEYIDGSVIAQLGTTDMRIPIAYALSYPDRIENAVPPLDLAEMCRTSGGGGGLTFSAPDFDRFPALPLAYTALDRGGSMPAVMSAANETAVSLFLQQKIDFLDIVNLVSDVMERHRVIEHPTLEEILEADIWAKREAEERGTRK